CAIGSVKSNIGHCEAAAGVAGLTKVLLQMKHRTLVPSLYSQQLNPNIDLAGTRFRVQQQLEDWERPIQESRDAGVSSFGAGGVNAHVVLEEYVEEEGSEARRVVDEKHPALIVVSAKSEEQLKQQARNLRDYLQGEGGQLRLEDIAYTLQVGR